MKKLAVTLLATAVASTSLTGCMGRHALTKEVEEFNLEVVEHRWAREGVFILLLPVQYVTNIADLLVLNSIEFWSGKNPINHKGALVDVKVASLQGNGLDHVAKAQMRYLEDEVLMYVSYADGSQEVFHATRKDGLYSFYRGKELVMQVNEAQLQDLQAAILRRMDSYAAMASPARES